MRRLSRAQSLVERLERFFDWAEELDTTKLQPQDTDQKFDLRSTPGVPYASKDYRTESDRMMADVKSDAATLAYNKKQFAQNIQDKSLLDKVQSQDKENLEKTRTTSTGTQAL